MHAFIRASNIRTILVEPLAQLGVASDPLPVNLDQIELINYSLERLRVLTEAGCIIESYASLGKVRVKLSVSDLP